MFELPSKRENNISQMINELEPNHLQSDGDHDHNSSPFTFDWSRFSNDTEMNVESDACEEMPPPLPYYKRNCQCVGPAKLGRASSESVPTNAPSASMPHGSRPQHNRVVGLTPEFHAPSYGGQLLQWRVDEFDALLADFWRRNTIRSTIVFALRIKR